MADGSNTVPALTEITAAYNDAVLACVGKLGECHIGAILDRLSIRWKQQPRKVESALARLVGAGSLHTELRYGLAGRRGATRFYWPPEHTPTRAIGTLDPSEINAERDAVDAKILAEITRRRETYCTELEHALGMRDRVGKRLLKSRLETLHRRGVLLARKCKAGSLGASSRPRTYYRIAESSP